ncbi:MAG TPA: hypothetical protein VFX28_11700, partial [Methylomirabilota bacterium]|nr:hypothetical protein [Methylomirabilota bacterium]
ACHAVPGLHASGAVHPACHVCREIERAPMALLYLYIVLAWTPFRPQRMQRFLDGHDFGCDERFAAYR